MVYFNSYAEAQLAGHQLMSALNVPEGYKAELTIGNSSTPSAEAATLSAPSNQEEEPPRYIIIVIVAPRE